MKKVMEQLTMKKLNFGCGKKILEGYDNVDIQSGEGIVNDFDFDVFPYPIKDNIYNEVLGDFILEHLDNPKKALEEIYRICKSEAKVIIQVPYYNNKGAYADFTHRSYLSERCFVNFVNEINQVNQKERFEIISLRLIPTKFGKLFPKQFRRKLSAIFSGIIRIVFVELRVIK